MKEINEMSREEIIAEIERITDKIEYNQQNYPEIHNLPLFELCLDLQYRLIQISTKNTSRYESI